MESKTLKELDLRNYTYSQLTEVRDNYGDCDEDAIAELIDQKGEMLESELEKANKLLLKTNQVHIENQQLQKDLNGEREINQRLTDELEAARAEIERLKDCACYAKGTEGSCNWPTIIIQKRQIERMQADAKEATRILETTMKRQQSHVEKLKTEIEQKDALIEQMRESLEWALSFPACTCDDHDTRWQEQTCSCGHASRVQRAMAALEAAERIKE